MTYLTWNFHYSLNILKKHVQLKTIIMKIIELFHESVHSVVSNSLRSHGLQHARLPYPSPTPGACSSSCPSSRWCHPTISSSVVLFSSRLQSFPASGSFPMSQFFSSGGHSFGASLLASVLPMKIQDLFPLGLTGCISLQSKALSRVNHSWKASILWHSAFFMVQLWHPYMTTGKTIALTRQTFVGKVIWVVLNWFEFRRLITILRPVSKATCKRYGIQSIEHCTVEAQLKGFWTLPC